MFKLVEFHVDIKSSKVYYYDMIYDFFFNVYICEIFSNLKISNAYLSRFKVLQIYIVLHYNFTCHHKEYISVYLKIKRPI